jgi:GNAT superfamily N-acetyltransferase
MIRAAHLADIPRLVELGVRFMRESRYGLHLTVNAEATAELAASLINAEHGLVLVDEQDGEIVGMIGVVATLHPHSGDPVMSELFWYVLPRARGSGVRLLLEAEAWARANGIGKSIVVSPNEILSALYERLGYEPLERQFIKKPLGTSSVMIGGIGFFKRPFLWPELYRRAARDVNSFSP